MLAFTPPCSLLKTLRTSASWLCLSLISFCQAFVFDHRSSVSTLLLLLSTSFPPLNSFDCLPTLACVPVCVCTCTYAYLMLHTEGIFVGIFVYGWVSLRVHKKCVFTMMTDDKRILFFCSDMIISKIDNMEQTGCFSVEGPCFTNGWMAHYELQV